MIPSSSVAVSAVAWLVVALTALPADAAEAPAFPSAVGFAARATGGRAGEVYHVTNLNDSGTGSFRDGVKKPGRFVVFEVAGKIELKSPVSVASDITIAGQSAPGDGICVRNYEVSISGSHNVIVRYLRFRQGLTKGQEHKYVIGMGGCHDVILDHCSIEWGRWDCIGMSKSTNITVQYCIIGEGIDPQRFGCLCESDEVTFSHNLWINNQSRSPKAKGKIEYINNVIYNWGVTGLAGGHSGADHFLTAINNVFIKGPDSSNHAAAEFTETDHVFQTGNVLSDGQTGTFLPRAMTAEDFTDKKGRPTFLTEARVSSVPATQVDPPEVALKRVLESSGCALHRDAHDKRLIAQVQSYGKAGKIIHDPAEVGGFGENSAAPRRDPAAGYDGTLTPTGYTSLEMHLNEQTP